MVAEQIVQRGISDINVISAFNNIPREPFVPYAQKNFAYEDRPLSIGRGQTISQPYTTALMTSVLSLKKGNRVLEIGTGSGYQSAVLSYLGAELYTVEYIPELAKKAVSILGSLGFNIHIKVGDGALGWQENSPFDRIIITAALKYIPSHLIDQLKIGGKIVAPVGDKWQQKLIVFDKLRDNSLNKTVICDCVFVPLAGKYGYAE